MMVCDGPILWGPNKGKSARSTSTGYGRHYKAGEKPCQDCRDGHAAEELLREDRRKGDKAGRRRAGFTVDGEWCKSLEHRMTPENTYTTSAGARKCRACATARARIYRKTVECTACSRWFTPEVYDAHRVAPPGNPNAPLECLSEELMMPRFSLVKRNGPHEYYQERKKASR